ncbi:MAG: hypothetical protein E7359_03290 [Clostridiales bacterium]|nr:hypothetical protein [Clostridiales bacterium]
MKNFLFKLAMLATTANNTANNWGANGEWNWVRDLVNFLKTLLPYVLIVVATAGTIYAVVLGVNMARAEDASKREEAKKRIINFVIALAVTILLIVLLNVFVTYIPGWLGVTLPQ